MFANLFLSWWTFALRGFLAIVFGLLALIWPQQAMPGLVVIFGTFVLTERESSSDRWASCRLTSQRPRLPISLLPVW
jgi:hypothetical protein